MGGTAKMLPGDYIASWNIFSSWSYLKSHNISEWAYTWIFRLFGSILYDVQYNEFCSPKEGYAWTPQMRIYFARSCWFHRGQELYAIWLVLIFWVLCIGNGQEDSKQKFMAAIARAALRKPIFGDSIEASEKQSKQNLHIDEPQGQHDVDAGLHKTEELESCKEAGTSSELHDKSPKLESNLVDLDSRLGEIVQRRLAEFEIGIDAILERKLLKFQRDLESTKGPGFPD